MFQSHLTIFINSECAKRWPPLSNMCKIKKPDSLNAKIVASAINILNEEGKGKDSFIIDKK